MRALRLATFIFTLSAVFFLSSPASADSVVFECTAVAPGVYAATSSGDQTCTIPSNLNISGFVLQTALDDGGDVTINDQLVFSIPGDFGIDYNTTTLSLSLGLGDTIRIHLLTKNSFAGPTGGAATLQVLGSIVQPPPVASPGATTYAATGITQTSATLNGGIDPGGTATTYWFEWGVSSGQLQVAGNGSAGSGTDIVPVFFSLSGLTSNTLYFYRVVAENAGGITRGALVSFTTKGVGTSTSLPTRGSAAAAITNPASDITTTSATLNGSVNPNGASTNVWFDWGLSDSLGNSSQLFSLGSGTSLVSVRVGFSDADPGTTYYYRVMARNSFGWSYGAILSFRTAVEGGDGGTEGDGVGGTAPTTRTTVATNVSKTAATLNGIVNPNGASTQAWFEYGPTKQLGQASEMRSLGSGTFPVGASVAVFNLVTDTTYYYRLVARNAFGVTRGEILSTVSSGSPTFAVSPAARTINAGNAADFTASYDPDGAGPKPTVDVTASSTWNSSHAAVASHEGRGRFRGAGAGRAIVTAFYNSTSGSFWMDDAQNLTAQAMLTVNQPGSALFVQTDAATDVKPDTAILHGSVNTNNSKADVWFEYGPNEFLGQTVGDEHLPGASGKTDVSVPLAGLESGTTYYYRIAARNALGTLYGSTMTFTTSPGVSWRWLATTAFVIFAVAALAGLVFALVKFIRRRREESEEVASV